MRKMLSHAFSTKALVEQEFVLTRSVDDFMYHIGTIKAEGGKTGVDITKWFNNVTFDIMGGMAFGDSFGARVGNYGPKSRWFLSYGQEFGTDVDGETDDKYDWVGVVLDSAFINDVMRCTTLVPYLPEFLDWWIPRSYQESSYAHMDYSIIETRA
jgi:hypothetical protein